MGMDQEQIIAALRDHGDRLLRSAFLLCGNAGDAEDIVQETFLQAIRSVHRFEGRSNVYTWLHAILLNIARRHYRNQKRIIYDDGLASREAAPTDVNHSQCDAAVAAAALEDVMQKLSPPHREVIVLRYFENMRIHQMAAQLDVSEGTIKSRLHYAIAEMKKLLPEELNLFGGGGTKEMKR